MGQAHRRKQIQVLGRGPKARGTGLHYIEPRTPVVHKLTAAQLADREKMKTTIATRGIRKWNVFALETFSARQLDAWEEKILAEKNISIDDGYLPILKPIDRALRMAITVVNKHCDHNGVEVDGLLQALELRRSKTQPNGYLNEALAFLIKGLSEMFEKVLREENLVEGGV